MLARPSSMPVSRRATHRLIRQLDLVGQEEAIGDEAVERYDVSASVAKEDESGAAGNHQNC